MNHTSSGTTYTATKSNGSPTYAPRLPRTEHEYPPRSLNPVGFWPAGQPAATITDHSGATYQFAAAPSNGTLQNGSHHTHVQLPQTITDKNGNQLTLSPQNAAIGSASYIDTLGRTVAAWNGLSDGSQLALSGLGVAVERSSVLARMAWMLLLLLGLHYGAAIYAIVAWKRDFKKVKVPQVLQNLKA